MKIIEIKDNNTDLLLLQNFIDNLGEAKNKFRYFNSRNINVIENHLVTLLAIEDGRPVGYGHLDLEEEVVWLGISVLPDQQGKGFGKDLIQALLDKARKLNLLSILLTVDRNNESAQNLYEKFNFKKIEENLLYNKYKLILKNE